MKNNAQLLMPREKMLKFGISALTDVELLALFLRTGTRGKDVLTLAKEMLENFGSLYGLLTSEYEQFSGVHGIGVAKFAQLKGIAELARRYYNVRMREESPLLLSLIHISAEPAPAPDGCFPTEPEHLPASRPDAHAAIAGFPAYGRGL